MKYSSIKPFLYIFFCFIFLNNLNSMDTRPIIIILDGPTCCGKTSLSRCFMDVLKKRFHEECEYVAVDDIDDEVDDSDEVFEADDEFLHTFTIKKIKNSVLNGKRLILCDTVLNDIKWFNLFRTELNQNTYRVFYIFVHCPLPILIDRLALRNIHARSSGDLDNLREVRDLLYAFGLMYCRSQQNCGLSMFSYQDFDSIVHLVANSATKASDWVRFLSRYDVFDIKETDAPFFLNLKIQHDLIVHNYPNSEEPQFVDESYTDASSPQDIVNHRCVKDILKFIRI